MNKNELTILLTFAAILISINIVNFIKREGLKKNYGILVEERDLQISINSTGVAELENLPGIGPKLAQRIVEYRNLNGEFKNLADIKRVKGVGDKLFKKILPYIKL